MGLERGFVRGMAAAGAALLVATLPLTPARADGPAVVTVSPTVFFKTLGGGQLAQQADVTLSQASAEPVTITVNLGGQELATELPAGSTTGRVNVPDIEAPAIASFRVDDGEALEREWRPQRKWDLWLQPSTHIDLYSTANADYTPKEHAEVIGTALDLLHQHDDYRYQIENTIPLEEFLARDEELFGRDRTEELGEALQSGRLAVGAQYTGFHHSEASDESAVQGQYANARTQDILTDLGVRPNAALVYDVPGLGLSLPQVARQSGIETVLFSPNHSYRLYERLKLPWLFRWTAPDGSSVLTWRSAWNYGYEKNQYWNLEAGADAAAPTVNRMLLDRQEGKFRNPYGEVIEYPDEPEILSYPLEDLLILWDYGDNTVPTTAPLDFATDWNERFAFPRVRLGTFTEFTDHIRATENIEALPEVSGEVLDAWTFIVMNQGLINQFTRRAHRALPAAATWAALAEVLGGSDDHAADFETAWSDVGRTEGHDWFYGTFPLDDVTGLPVPNPGLPLPFGAGEGKVPDFMIPDLDKMEWAKEAEALSRSLLAQGASALAGLVTTTGDEVVVLNNGTETRSDLVAVPATTKHLVDLSTGREVPTQRISGPEWASGLGARPVMAAAGADDVATQPVGDVVVFVAPNIPGLGYKRFALRDSPGEDPGAPLPPNRRYRLEFDPVTGGLASIEHDGRELVDSAAPWNLGEVLVGLPATDFGDIFDTPQPAKDQAQKLTAQSMQVVTGGFPGVRGPTRCGPVLCETRVTGTVGDEHRTMVVVTYERLERVDLVVSTAFTKVKQERFVVAFPLAGDADDMTYNVPFAEHRVGRDEAPSEPSVHRMLADWIEVGADTTPRRATAVSSPDLGPFTVGRPDVNLMTGQFTVPDDPWYFPVLLDTTAGGAVSVGTYVARFSIAEGHGDVGGRLGASSREPLVAAAVGAHQGPLAGASGSLIDVHGGRVTAVKTPRAGSGLVVRVLASGGSLTVTPSPALGLGPARRTTLQEEIVGEAVGTIQASEGEIVTLRYDSGAG